MIKQAYKNLIFAFTVLTTAVFGVLFSSNTASAAWTIDANNVIVSYVTISNSTVSSVNVSGNWTTTTAFSVGSNNTVTFDGTTTQTITGATTWNDLTINNSYATPDDTYDVDPGAVQTVAGTLTVTDGQWSSYTGDDYVNVTIETNGIIKPDAGITVSGNWDNSGTFTHNSGTVTFDGAGGSTQYILGNTTFNNFTANAGASARTLLFGLSDTQTVSGAWTITGEAGKLITLGIAPACGSATSVTDDDEKTYNLVSVGAQCWTASNMNSGTRVNGSAEQNQDSTVEKYCYSDTEANCTTDGGLYQWAEAMQLANSCNTTDCSGSINTPHQGICPLGYHIPTDTEWTTLTDYLSANSEYWCNETSTYIAKSLASTSGWTTSATTCAVGNTQSSNNTSGFAAIPAGDRITDGSFNYRASYGDLWSTSQLSASSSWYRNLDYSSAMVYRYLSNKQTGFSVRCLKD